VAPPVRERESERLRKTQRDSYLVYIGLHIYFYSLPVAGGCPPATCLLFSVAVTAVDGRGTSSRLLRSHQ
jgi:hypothetical protein